MRNRQQVQLRAIAGLQVCANFNPFSVLISIQITRTKGECAWSTSQIAALSGCRTYSNAPTLKISPLTSPWMSQAPTFEYEFVAVEVARAVARSTRRAHFDHIPISISVMSQALMSSVQLSMTYKSSFERSKTPSDASTL